MTNNTYNRAAKTTLTWYILWGLAKFFFFLFYKKVYIYGKNNIPDGYPIIFAPNHQNAVMDPLAVLFTQPRPTLFLARADVFKGKRTINFLNTLKILPVYRQRDGVENLSKNEEIFNATVNILKKKEPICLMAEGNHGNQHKLRPLVKGMFRIALSAQDSLLDTSKGVRIVPVGLYYHDYVKFNHKFAVNYGKPIAIEDYYELYKEKPARALNKLRTDLSEAMSANMIDIKSDDYYECIYFVQQNYSREKTKNNPKEQFPFQKKLCDKFNLAVANDALFLPQLNQFHKTYTALLQKYNLRDWNIETGKTSLFRIFLGVLASVILLPFRIYGGLINFLPNYLAVKPTKKIKDLQFHSSVKFFITFIGFTLYYLITSIAVGFIFKSALLAIGFVLISAISGLIGVHMSNIWKKTKARFRFYNASKRNKEDVDKMIVLRKKLMLFADLVYNQ